MIRQPQALGVVPSRAADIDGAIGPRVRDHPQNQEIGAFEQAASLNLRKAAWIDREVEPFLPEVERLRDDDVRWKRIRFSQR